MPGFNKVIERWGLLGYSRYCMKNGVIHGKWIAFENGKLAIEGRYKFGKKDDKWIYYHNDGRIYRIVIYDQNQIIKDIIINK